MPLSELQHFSGAVTSQLLVHVEMALGPDGPERLLARAGETRPVEALSDPTSWSSYDQVRALFEAATELLGGQSLHDMHLSAQMVNKGRPWILNQIQMFGAPDAVYRSVGGRLPVSTIVSLETREIGPSDWIIGHTMDPGFDPYPEMCAYITALNGMIPVMFGMPVTHLVEESCVCRGDDECLVRVSWEGNDEASTMAFLQARLGLAERRAEELRDIVAKMVSDDDLEAVLDRMVEAADKAIWARGFVLSLGELPGSTRRVYARGVSAEEATTVAEAILGDEGAGSLGNNSLVVDVASANRHYGRLAVLGLRRMSGEEQQLVESYFGLLAARLDSAVALEEARRQATTSRILLDLSARLAHMAPPTEIAERLVQALPGVVDCDAAGVMLVSEGKATLTATMGLSPDKEALVRAWLRSVHPSILRADRTVTMTSGSDPATRQLFTAAGFEAMALAPVLIDGTTVGLIGVSVSERAERLQGDPDLQGRLDGLAGQFSSALRNARLVEQIRHQALHDPLTGVANRTLLLEETEKALALSRRNGTPVAAFFIDLDDFKQVNDSLGHPAGDRLLQAVAGRLQQTVRNEDSVGRLGGDEFVVLAQGPSLDEGAESMAARLLEVLGEPLVLTDTGQCVPVGASIGVAVGDRPCAKDLISDADVALYHSKILGRGRYSVFSPEMATRTGSSCPDRRGAENAVARTKVTH